MIRKVMALVMLTFASTAVASSYPISYNEEFKSGYDVDLNQGFYVCDVINPRDLMMKLINIQDDTARRRYAGQAGCPFRMTSREDVSMVVYEASSVCLDRHTADGGFLREDGSAYEGPIISCGREGHQFVVNRNGREQVVIFISLDVDYD